MVVRLGIFSVFLTCVAAKMTGHISGGEYSFIWQYPHSVFMKITGCYHARCGASIITQDMVLTAAVCFYQCKKYSIELSMGNEREGLGQVRKIIDFIIHEKFSKENHANDVGLGLMDKPVKFGKNIRRVALMDVPPFYEPAFMSGWGWISPTGHISFYLKHGSQKLADKEACKRNFKDLVPEYGTFCMLSGLNNSRANDGDTGNPLVVESYIQIGIVSWGNFKQYYNMMVYTNISYHLSWIKHNSKILYCRKNR